jgi:hypothetical protein
MTVSFNTLKANGQLFTSLPELDDLEFSLSNANAADVLDALGIRRRLLREPLAPAVLQSPPRRRPAQARWPRLARHPGQGDAGTRLHGSDRLRQARRLHRAEACPSLRSREPRSRLARPMSGGAEALTPSAKRVGDCCVDPRAFISGAAIALSIAARASGDAVTSANRSEPACARPAARRAAAGWASPS